MNVNERNLRKRTRKAKGGIPVAALLLLALSACTTGTPGLFLDTTGVTGGTGTTASPETFTISNVTIGAATGTTSSSTTASTTTIFLTSTSTPLTNHCLVSSEANSAKGCSCRFSWQEVNTQGGSSVSIPRTVETPLTIAQASLATCSAPSVFSAEILDGTAVKVTIVPGLSNPDTFVIPEFSLTKDSNGGVASSFQDSEGRSFINIHRYTCHEKNSRTMGIGSKLDTITNPEPETGELPTVKVPLANQFCIEGTSGSPADSANCGTMKRTETSAEAYYFNLYIRASNVGNINEQNTAFSCPVVKEALSNDGTVASKNKFWPLDTQFALALNKSKDFTVGVEASSCLQGGSGTCQPSSCTATSDGSGASSTSAIATTCLGFAAPSNSDGTCPFIKDSLGRIKNTYRLRRYFAMYPQRFNPNGRARTEARSVDTIYVLDRPVASSQADPRKPFTMLGPKPCPFAYFDKTGGRYVATNDSSVWNGSRNVDAIELPNTDSDQNSCAAMIPFIEEDDSNGPSTPIALSTIHFTNANANRRSMPIRPLAPWSPHYEEDLDFQACAPASDPFIDPPLHLARRNADEVAWCAEVYPTQNDNVDVLDGLSDVDPTLAAFVPFTSHRNAEGNVASTPACAPTTLDSFTTSNKHAGGTSGEATCDRTVRWAQDSAAFAKVPLLAPASSVTSALTETNSKPLSGGSHGIYSCAVTYDNNGARSSSSQSPSQGCCANAANPSGSGTNGHHLDSVNDHVAGVHSKSSVICTTPTY